MHPAGVQTLHLLCTCHNASHVNILCFCTCQATPKAGLKKPACTLLYTASTPPCFQGLLNGDHEGPAHPQNGISSGAPPSGPSTEPGLGPGAKRADPSMALPESEAEHAALAAVRGYPRPGDIVAYKLLEIGADWAPVVCF